MILSMCTCFTAQAASYKIGDLNGDGRISASDVLMLKRALVGLKVENSELTGDINRDGRVTVADLALLLRVLVGVYIIEQPDDENVPVSEYTVVYPQSHTDYELYAAQLLCDYVSDNCGVNLTMTDDSAAPVDREILVGHTNRSESSVNVTFEKTQYLLKKDGEKIVLLSDGYMIGGAVGKLTYDCLSGSDIILDNIGSDNTLKEYTPIKATGAILMIGDGMGFNHVAYADYYYQRNTELEYNGFDAMFMPNQGQSVTYALSSLKNDGTYDKVITDSAAGATAMATGWKTQRRFLGKNVFGADVQNVRELAYLAGAKTAVMSTEPLTGATPSGFTVHNGDRGNADEIAAAQQALIDNGQITYMKGNTGDDMLSETRELLKAISTDSKNGFFAMIEEAYIDKAATPANLSDYDRNKLAYYMYRFDTAIEYAMTFAASRPDTVLIVTADHESGGLRINGTITTNDHTNQNVPIYAMGQGTEAFNGATVLNTEIAVFIAKIFGAESFGGQYSNIND